MRLISTQVTVSLSILQTKDSPAKSSSADISQSSLQPKQQSVQVQKSQSNIIKSFKDKDTFDLEQRSPLAPSRSLSERRKQPQDSKVS